MPQSETFATAGRLYLFAQPIDGKRPVVIRRWPAGTLFGPNLTAWAADFASGRCPLRWYLVECANAERGRDTIADHFASPNHVPSARGRILALGVGQ